MSLMNFGEYKAVIKFDDEIEMFRGEFVDLNGGADFYARDIEGLKKEGQLSLDVFIDECKKAGINPKKEYSGKFIVRITPDLHEKIAQKAIANNISLNNLVSDALKQQL